MIFFIASDGTIIKSTPTVVYQGSEEASVIRVVAPFAANAEVTAAFKLPNGELISPILLTDKGIIEGVINSDSGKPYAVWEKSISEPIARYFGVVQIQLHFAFADRTLTTSMSTFTVGKGVPRLLPETPRQDVYDDILSNIVSIKSRLDNIVFVTADDTETTGVNYTIENNVDKSFKGAVQSVNLTIPEDITHGFQSGVNIKGGESDIPCTIDNKSGYEVRYVRNGYGTDSIETLSANRNSMFSFFCDGIAVYCILAEV